MHRSTTGIEFIVYLTILSDCFFGAHGDAKVETTLSQWTTTDTTDIVAFGQSASLSVGSGLTACDGQGRLAQKQFVSTRAIFCGGTIDSVTAATSFVGTERMHWLESSAQYRLIV
tara:strand:- start:4478 stop:4822 length:345 start_codon:yes stop_codon:yes gene_type:complete